jgi:High potential iron-sulfur protein
MKVISRRAWLLSLGLLAAAGLPRRAAAANASRTLLDEKEPAAVKIGYVANSRKVDPAANPGFKRSHTCATCAYIEFGTARQRGCSLVPGRLVEAGGWCKLWKLKGTK